MTTTDTAGTDPVSDRTLAEPESSDDRKRLASFLARVARAALEATGARTASATVTADDEGTGELRATAERVAAPVDLPSASEADLDAEQVVSVPIEGARGEPRGTVSVGGGRAHPDHTPLLEELALLARLTVDALEGWSLERERRAEVEGEAWRRTVLAEAGKIFSSSLEPEEIVTTLGRAVVPALADFIVLHVLPERLVLPDGTEHIRAPDSDPELADRGEIDPDDFEVMAFHRDPDMERRLRAHVEHFPPRPSNRHGVGAVLRTGRVQVLDLRDERLDAASLDGARREAIRALRLSGIVTVPLRARGRLMGALTLGRHRDEAFSEAAVELAEQLAERAALTVSNARMLRATRELTDELRQTVDRLDMALEAGQMATWRWDLRTDEADWSEGFEALCGYEPGGLPRTLDAFLSIVHPEERGTIREQLERARREGSGFRYRCRVERPDGALRWLEGAGQAVREAGAVAALVGVVSDVTESVVGQRRIEHERRLVETMHEVGKAVVSRLDWDELVDVVTRAGMRLTSARFGVFVTAEPGAPTRVRAHALHGSPARGATSLVTAAELIGLDQALQGETVQHDDLDADVDARRSARPDAPVPLRSSLAVPVVSAHGEVLGVLAFGDPTPHAFNRDHRRVIEGIASQAAIAIDNARLYRSAQRQLEVRQRAFEERDHVAQVLQHSLLPPALPRIPGVEVAGRYRPGSHEIGGDFYDLIPLDDGWVVVVGDVCGKGPEAASLTALARHTLRTAGLLGQRPEEALAILNRTLLMEPGESTSCSALFAHAALDEEALVLDVALAGHPPPLALRAGGDVEHVGVYGTMLGLVRDVDVVETRVRLERGDLLALYTDGVIEARGGHGLFGIEGLSDLLRACRGLGAGEVAAAIEGRVELMGGRRVRDDVAVLTIRVE